MQPNALEALHVATAAIKTVKGISNVSVDNDAHSGEVIFDVSNVRYVLRLVEEDTE
jgi:hypothetical protein